ncbi:PAS domain-containing protein [Pseudoalteromonas xiamenensis]|uniref:PAS domain-containing protein n=1 Tax=Pseudoalteromonas xiamenensis TaxID=882626 RepID=UPI0035E58E86
MTNIIKTALEENLFFSQLLLKTSALNFLRHLVIESHLALVITDSDISKGLKIIYANDEFCKQMGYQLAEIVGMSPAIFKGPLSDQKLIDQVKKQLAEKGCFFGSSVSYKKDGSFFPVQWSISDIRDEDGEVTHYFMVQKDLSRQTRLIEQMKRSNELFKEHIRNNKSKVEVSEQIVSQIMENEKYYSTVLFEGVELFEDPFEDLFFDIDTDNEDQVTKTKEPLSSEKFLSRNTFEEDDIQSLFDNIDDILLEIELINSRELDLSNIEKISNAFGYLSSSLYFFYEFNDAAIVLDELAKQLRNVDCNEIFPIAVLESLSDELKLWLSDIFVTSECENIYEKEANILAMTKQLLSML